MKCKYNKQCPYYKKDSPVCNKYGGMYYGVNRPAGCYREMERKIKEY